MSAYGADRDPLLMGGQLGDGVAENGWATDQCMTGTPRVMLYKSPRISYLIENTKKNSDPVVEIKAQIALGEVQLENPQLTSEAKEIQSLNSKHFEELCGQFYSGYIYGGVISIARKLKEGAVVEDKSVSLDHSEDIEQLLSTNYKPFQKSIDPNSGVYMHMNPINEKLLVMDIRASDLQRIITFIKDFKNKKAESQNVIQPLKSIFADKN